MRLTRKLGMAIMAMIALTASSCVTLHKHRRSGCRGTDYRHRAKQGWYHL